MRERDGEECPSRRPEIFWVLFVLVSAGVFAAVVEPARRQAAAARLRVRRARAELEEHRRHLEDMRRVRRRLERDDPEAWTAAARALGMSRPGERRVPVPEGGRERPER